MKAGLKLFGTDGIRARAGEFPLDSHTLTAIGHAIGERLRGKILIGQDTRVSSPWIFDRLLEGISKTTAQIEDAGVIPTPAIALLTKKFGYDGGVMISASHNRYDDNGIKVFAADGRKLNDADELALEQRIGALLAEMHKVDGDVVPNEYVFSENGTGWPRRYEDLLISHFSNTKWLQGVHVLVDCANGATTEVAFSILQRLGARLTLINAQPSGRNINENCGAVHLESLSDAMQKTKADFGVAFDGDGDRAMFISSSGRLIDGDGVLLFMARRMERQGQLAPRIVVGTQMTNFSLERILAAEGIRLTRVAVGDRFIFEEMQRTGALIGGEPSGHIIFSDFKLSGDGLLTMLKVADAMMSEHASLDELTRDWKPSPQLLKGVLVKRKAPIEDMPILQAKIAEVTDELRNRGRLVIRYSGTEPLLRVMIESDDAARNERLMQELLSVVSEEL